MLNARFKSLNSLCSQFQFAKMMAVTLISKLCPRKIKLWMKIQFNEQILPLVVLGLNIAWTVLISIPPLIWTDLLSVFGVTLSSGSEVISMPIHLMYSTIDEDKAYGQQSFRESSLLQGTFDLLLGISSKQSLLYGLEYEIKFIFEVQENEKSENVSIFLKVRILLFLYLVQYYLYIQYRKACSQCVFPGFLVCCMILNMDNVERQYLSNRVPYFQEH